ncbi:MAG: PorT family protein [Candidatus Cloacimonetes bacterium]|nr:PorT family protein [Candidatus Cloacimonadota bacterium]
MKKSIFLFVLIVLLGTSLFANGIVGKGVKLGFNFAKIDGNDVEINFDSKLGFIIGGFAIFQMTDMIFIQPELFYTMKGAKDDGEGYVSTISLNYLELPVLAKFNIPIEGNLTPNLFFGPALGINLSSTHKVEYDDYDDVSDDLEDIKGMEFGLIFGGGININKICIDARYNLGLSSIDDSSDSEDVKNRVFSILLGYMF